ncbi:DUF2255 family protein [Pseudonocardia endophytica]|uniref:DUF2255 family protein n=1 Tax=Pseudonocardia endophytica TaxID=401976 RepID=A0A4R1HSZ4_PSEEN|nr:DUF2255 family protein [Pseudonocardia endophytica]TCK25784.1 hypothetical protein EV378_1606 [Pseudonocardia endophytica]
MPHWTHDQLAALDQQEVTIATRRRDGELRTFRTVWVVRDGDNLFVRSAYGRESAWFRGTRSAHEGRIEAGGTAVDIAFVDVDDPDLAARLDEHYRTKYAASPGPIATMIGDDARRATMRLDPR